MIKRNWINKFLDPDEGGGFGGESGGEMDSQEGSPQSSQQTQSATLDPKAFAQEFGSVIAEQFKQQQKPAGPKTYTPEEIAEARKSLKFWEPDDQFITEFGNLETQKGAFTKLRDGLMNQFVEIQRAMLAQQEEKWNSKFQPVQSLIEQRHQAEQISRFETQFPALANPKLADFREAVGQKLMASGAFNGKSEAEAFSILANAMAESIKAVSPDFSLGEPAAPASRSARSSNAITPQSHGSGGGGSGGSANGGDSGPKLPKAASLFSKIRG